MANNSQLSAARSMRQVTPRSNRSVGLSRSMLLVLLLFAAIAGCDINDYVPSADKLRDPKNPTAPFIVDERDIHGIYGNVDVDSAIYTYITTTTNEYAFWVALDEATSKDEWTLREKRERFRRYTRIIPRTGQQVSHSAEEVRVAFIPETNRVFVAWVQADERTLPEDFPDSGPEGNFAKNVIWPHFEQEIAASAEKM